MAAHVLDNPVWHSLTTQHAGLALTADGAARYPAAIVPFAATPPGGRPVPLVRQSPDGSPTDDPIVIRRH